MAAAGFVLTRYKSIQDILNSRPNLFIMKAWMVQHLPSAQKMYNICLTSIGVGIVIYSITTRGIYYKQTSDINEKDKTNYITFSFRTEQSLHLFEQAIFAETAIYLQGNPPAYDEPSAPKEV